MRNLKTALSPDEVESASREADLFLRRNKNDIEPTQINTPSKVLSSPGTNDHDEDDISPPLDNRPERNLHEMSAGKNTPANYIFKFAQNNLNFCI